MAIKVNTLLAFPLPLLLLLLLLPLASSHNITTILSNFPDFSSFNELLSRTGVASQINSRATITVLAVDNGAASAVTGRPLDELRNILSVHVVLDFYDADKLQKLANHSAILTTLFQATGLAVGHNGFLNVTDTGNGQVAFGSAVPGSALVSNLVKVVVEQPYNISVLQVSSIVVPPGIDGGAKNGSGDGSAAGAPAHASPAGAPAHASPSGAPEDEKAPSPAGDAPSSEASAAPASSGSPDASPAPAADGPSDSPADGPSDSPAGGPSDSPAEGPGGAGDEAEDGTSEQSAAEKAVAGLAGVAAAMSFAVLGSL